MGLIHGGAYFRNFTVAFLYPHAFCENEKTEPITMRNETLKTAKIELFHLFFSLALDSRLSLSQLIDGILSGIDFEGDI